MAEMLKLGLAMPLRKHAMESISPTPPHYRIAGRAILGLLLTLLASVSLPRQAVMSVKWWKKAG